MFFFFNELTPGVLVHVLFRHISHLWAPRSYMSYLQSTDMFVCWVSEGDASRNIFSLWFIYMLFFMLTYHEHKVMYIIFTIITLITRFQTSYVVSNWYFRGECSAFFCHQKEKMSFGHSKQYAKHIYVVLYFWHRRMQTFQKGRAILRRA